MKLKLPRRQNLSLFIQKLRHRANALASVELSAVFVKRMEICVELGVPAVFVTK